MADQRPAWDDLPSWDSLPDATPQQAQGQQSAARPSWDSLPSWEELPDAPTGSDQQRPASESTLATGVREGVHALAPGAAGMALMPFGAAAGAPLGPVGSFVGGAGAFIGGALAAGFGQDKLLKKVIGYDDDPQRQANKEAHPIASDVGGIVGNMATMSPFGVGQGIAKQVATRAAGGAMMGGFEVGSELLQDDKLDPTMIGLQTIAGAIAPNTNRLGKKLQAPAEKWLAGRPGKVANPAAAQAHEDVGASQTENVAAGGSTEQTKSGPTGETTGNPQSAPVASERHYGKDRLGSYNEENILTQGHMDPATIEALGGSMERSALHNDAQTATLPKQAPPEQSLPMHTGIVEAAGAQPTTESIGAKLRKPKRGPAPPPEIDAGFPKPGDPVAAGASPAVAPDLSKLTRPPKAETAIERSKAAAETPTDRIDTGFPKPGEEVAVGSSEPLTPTESPMQKLSKQGYTKEQIMSMSPEEVQKNALANLTRKQPEKTGATKPNDTVSDAQKRAGNYQKAAVREFGHDLKIETERGDKRRSLDDSPVKWESTSPADYGYFKKTVGADKDHVDFYRADPEMAEFGDKHFIVDQRNHETGKFDEHKVMTYFKDLSAARDTYKKAFSDDKGLNRLHDITEVSDKDLAEWLRRAKKNKPYGEPMPKEVTATVKKPKAKTGVEIEGAEGVTANTVDEAARKSKALKDYQKVFDDHAPVKDETRDETIARARAAVAAARPLDTYPTKATVKQAPAQWLREARKIIKQPTEQMLTDFRSNELFLRSGNKDAIGEVRDTNRIDAGIKLARGRGSDAVEKAGSKEMPEGAPEEPGTDSPPSLVQNALDLHKLRAKNKELDLTKPADALEAAQDTRKLVDNLIKINDSDPGTRPIKAGDHAAEALSYVRERGEQKKPLKTKVGGKASEGRSISDPAEIQRILDAANERMAGKKALTRAEYRKEFAAREEQLKLEDVAPRDIGTGERELARKMDKRGQSAEDAYAEEGLDPKGEVAAKKMEDAADSFLKKFGKLTKDFGDNTSGSLNHTKIANDFKLKGHALRYSLEKYFGMPIGEVGRKADSVLAHSVATADSLSARKAEQLTERWFAWVKSPKNTQWEYMKTFEHVLTQTKKPDVEAALKLKGMSKDQASWMADEALTHRKLLDNLFLEDAKHGSTAEYHEGYLSHIFEGDARLAAEYIQKLGIKTLGANWYQKGRMFDLMEEAVKHGFKLKFTNPIDIIQARWRASINSNMLVSTARGLQDRGLAFPVKDVPKILVEREGWQFKRLLPDHQEWIFSPGAENLWINSMEPKGLNEMQNPLGGLFRGWMAIKRVWAPIQLAFSAFHELHVAANINPAVNITRMLKLSAHEFKNKDFGAAFKASTGHAFDAAKWSLADPLFAVNFDHLPFVGKFLDRKGHFSDFAGRKAMNWWHMEDSALTPMQRIWKRSFQEGGMSPHQTREDVIGARRDFRQALADFSNAKGMGHAGPTARTALHGIARGIELMQEPMFKYQIPALKNLAYMRNIAAANYMDPTLNINAVKRGVVYREIAKNVDDRFGEMFYKGLFWNKTVKDAGIMSFLSLSWNLGQFRQVAGAAKNIGIGAARLMGHKQSPMAEAIYKGSDKATFVGAYVAFSMMSAGALSYMMTGNMPYGLDYVFPRSGHDNADGSPGRLSTPFNTREPYMLKAHAEQHNSWIGGAMEFLWNKMVLSPIVEIAQNKDFFGSKLYDVHAPWYKKALQAVDSTAGRMFNPISLSGADRAKQQGGGKVGQALAYAGFSPAPKYVEHDHVQNALNHAYADEAAPSSRPYQYGPKTGLGKGLAQGIIRSIAGDKTEGEARIEARQEMNKGFIEHDDAAVLEGRRKLVTEGGLSTPTASKLRPDTEFESKFARLPKETQAAMAREMNDEQFRKYVLLNTQSGLSSLTKSLLIKERSTNR